jgi:hypothetical protein
VLAVLVQLVQLVVEKACRAGGCGARETPCQRCAIQRDTRGGGEFFNFFFFFFKTIYSLGLLFFFSFDS